MVDPYAKIIPTNSRVSDMLIDPCYDYIDYLRQEKITPRTMAPHAVLDSQIPVSFRYHDEKRLLDTNHP